MASDLGHCYNHRVRKAFALFVLPLLAACLLGTAWADTARDGTVNLGNASHLGAVEQPAVVNDGEPESSPGGGETQLAYEQHANDCGCEDESCGIIEFFGPIAVVNQHPSTVMFLSPAPDRAQVLCPGEAYFRVKLDWSNHLIREMAEGTTVDYDFETARFTGEYHKGLMGGEVSVRLPITYRGHGMLDDIISEWHRVFGLRNGWRDDFPSGMYRYTIITRDGLAHNEDGDSFGLGDIALEYKKALMDNGFHALAVRCGLKVPTGDSGQALGSGNWDLLLGGLYERQLTERLRGYANLDWVFVGEPDWENIGHQDMVVLLAALEYSINNDTTLISQYRYQRNPLRTGNDEADKDSQELTLGFNHRLTDRLVWAGSFTEDVNPETAPDFVMSTDFKWEF